MYAKWLLKKKIRHGDYERWTEQNPNADVIDAIIYFLEKNGGQIQQVEMKNDISALVARMRDLYS